MDGFKSGRWSREEDDILTSYVRDHGERRWNSIHKVTSLRRSGDSCQIRWMKTLKPGLKKGPFTEEEKKRLRELHNEFGDDWATIAQKIPGRTNRDVRHFWKRKMGQLDNSSIKFDSSITSTVQPQFPTQEYMNEDPLQFPTYEYKDEDPPQFPAYEYTDEGPPQFPPYEYTDEDPPRFPTYEYTYEDPPQFPTYEYTSEDPPQFPTYEYTYEDPPQLPPGSYICFFDEVAKFTPLPPAEPLI